MISRKELIKKVALKLYDFKIYVDLDGVLTDFVRSLKSVGLEDKENLTSEEWEIINKYGVDWWSEMNWMPDGKELWSYVKDYSPKILSAPSKSQDSIDGKKLWVKNHLGNTPLLLTKKEEKQKYADPNSILIDDNVGNIKRWRDAGGIGILHTSTAKTIAQLKEILNP